MSSTYFISRMTVISYFWSSKPVSTSESFNYSTFHDERGWQPSSLGIRCHESDLPSLLLFLHDLCRPLSQQVYSCFIRVLRACKQTRIIYIGSTKIKSELKTIKFLVFINLKDIFITLLPVINLFLVFGRERVLR